ncbi:MAG: hypothetical protein FWG31_00730 [Oscillospiraceae bacterium]|nr:hypothetical protein [Oscillospiraceae bacterium]
MMAFSSEVKDVYKKCMDAINPNEEQIDFLFECRNAEEGELRSYPLDDFVIRTFRITKQELSRYTKPEYAEHGVSSILEEILLERLAKVEGYRRTSLFGRV